MLSLVIDTSTILNESQSKLILKPSFGGLGSIPYNFSTNEIQKGKKNHLGEKL